MVNNILALARGLVRPTVTIAVVAAVLIGNYTLPSEAVVGLSAFAGPIVGFWFASRKNGSD